MGGEAPHIKWGSGGQRPPVQEICCYVWARLERLGQKGQVKKVRLGQKGQVRLVRLGQYGQVSKARLGQFRSDSAISKVSKMLAYGLPYPVIQSVMLGEWAPIVSQHRVYIFYTYFLHNFVHFSSDGRYRYFFFDTIPSIFQSDIEVSSTDTKYLCVQYRLY